MAVKKREVDVITCDACGKEDYLDEGEMPVGWYVGDVIYHHERGGSGGEWSACKPAHIKQAVIEAVNREY